LLQTFLLLVFVNTAVAVPLQNSQFGVALTKKSLAKPEVQPLDSIAVAVESFAYSQHQNNDSVNVGVRSLDKRLRLAQCDAPLTTNWSPGSRMLGRVTVQVACGSPKPWRIHVQATITMQSNVWTLSRAVRRGDILNRELLQHKEVTLGSDNARVRSQSTPITDISPWLGFAFVHSVGAGKMLNERMLKAPKLIGKGEAVIIRHLSSGLKLQTRGVALKDAHADEQTQVRNTSSGKVIDVVVVSPGIVETLR